MTLVLDAGAFVAVERGNRELAAEVKREWLAGHPSLTHGGVVGQVWRGGAGRQADLARVVRFVIVAPLDEKLGRRAGVLLAKVGSSDVIDAAVVLLAADDDLVLTSDAGDLADLAAATHRRIEIVPV